MPSDPALVPPTASWARRVGALVVDWLACWLVTLLVLGADRFSDGSGLANLVIPLVFLAESVLFGVTLGGSFGQVATGLRVVRTDGSGRWLDPVRMVARQVLVLLVVPPLVFRPDGRGLHDLACGTATVRVPDVPRPVGQRG